MGKTSTYLSGSLTKEY